MSAGLGAFVKFPCATKRFFQVSFAKAVLCQLCPFMSCDDSPQSFIAALEILAQSALVWTIQSMLPLARPSLRVVLCCDNSASEASAWKGLSMAKGFARCFVISAICNADAASLRALGACLVF